MSDQVFGNVITDAMVKKMDMSITNITARHRGELAVRYMYSDTKANEARAFVDDLGKRFGSGVSTRCSIYNATGSALTFVRCHTWEGKTWVSPYPHIIQNGQWATFLHVRDNRSSKEAVVYRGRNNAGNIREWLLAWDTRLTDIPNQNRVYTEVRASTSTINWNTVNANLERSSGNHTFNNLGCYSTASLGSGFSPYLTAIMSLEGLVRDAKAIFSSLDSEHKDDQGRDGVDEATPPPPATAAPPAE